MTQTDDLTKAKRKIISLLKRRDHSHLELKQKLSQFEIPIQLEALDWAESLRLIPDPEDQAERLKNHWLRAHKSARFIQMELRKRGLPVVEVLLENEQESIRACLKKKFGDTTRLDRASQAKAYRHLKLRGFKDSAIREVLWQKLGENS